MSLLNQVNNAQLKDYSSRRTTDLESTRYCVIVSDKGEKKTALKSLARNLVGVVESRTGEIYKKKCVSVFLV